MKEKHSPDWWLWQMYRQVAEYVNDPTEANASRLKSLIAEYRDHRQQQKVGLVHDHDWIVDFHLPTAQNRQY